jgi:hypothetical protein
VDALGYRGTFALLAGVGAEATALVVARVPETLKKRTSGHDRTLTKVRGRKEIHRIIAQRSPRIDAKLRLPRDIPVENLGIVSLIRRLAERETVRLREVCNGLK